MKKWVVFLTVVTFLVSGNAIADINDGLLAHYPFDGNASDASGNGFTGTINGATYTENGYDGGAYHFDGLHDNIDTIPRAQILSQITVSMWINPDVSQSNQLWGSGEQTWGSKDGYLAHVTVEGALNFYFWRDNATHGRVETANGIVPNNAWSHVVFTLDASRHAAIYLNGTLQAEGVFSTIPNVHDHTHLMIGRGFIGDNVSSNFEWTFQGTIDDVRIYNRALTTPEIQQLAAGIVTPPEPTQITFHELPQECVNAENIVFITHGWNGNAQGAESWPNDLKEKIKAKVIEAQTDDKLPEDSNSSWCYWAYDWSEDARVIDWFDCFIPGGDCINIPLDVYPRAETHGQKIALDLARLQDLQYVHFIAHSAGSGLIQAAIDKIDSLIDGNTYPLYESGTSFIANSDFMVNATFLDAYTPIYPLRKYGRHCDWAEQYVDKRPLGDSLFDTTDTEFPNLTNFAIDTLDTPTANPIARHAWPYEFYIGSTDSPSSCIGFPLSYESGLYGLSPSDWRSSLQNKYPCQSNCNNYKVSAISSGSCTLVEYNSTIVDDIKKSNLHIIPKIILLSSVTGTVNFIATDLFLGTSSPVWTTIELQINREVNTIEFDYQFLSNANGKFSVYFDNQLIYYSEEIYDSKELRTTEGITLGANIPYGSHTLSFRLDPMDTNQSQIKIGDIVMSKISNNTFPWPIFLPAITGENK